VEELRELDRVCAEQRAQPLVHLSSPSPSPSHRTLCAVAAP
jgi:hypothetical protein